MSLLDTARADLKAIMRNSTTGFGQTISVTAPDLVNTDVTGLGADIALAIDPETGTLVSGRFAHVSVDMEQLTTAFGELPRGVSNHLSKPWLVDFTDSEGTTHNFKVFKSDPDRALGLVVLTLELYN